MKTPITFYVNPAWRRGGQPSPLMYPFWGNPYGEVSLFAKEMFDAYQYDTSCYSITDDIVQADMVLSPYRHQWYLRYDKALFEECVRAAKEANLPLFIDGVGDVEFPIPVENAYILRIGGYQFLSEKGRIQIPPASDDLLERCAGGVEQVRPKREGEKPVIGFAGWAQLSRKQALRAFLKELPIRVRGLFDSRYRACTKGVFWRARATSILAKSNKVICNFRLRKTFSGSFKTASGDLRVLRQELVDTILGSDYALDVRGDANDSSRLFEILALGRIPLLVNTERNLPFRDSVRYEDFCVIVDFRDIKRLPEIIAEFHRTVTPERFEDMQRAARRAFVSYLRIDALMPHILEELDRLGFKPRA